MGEITSILQAAQQRAKDKNLPYQGALYPDEAQKLLQSAPGTQLVDVRCRAELDWVGRVPGAVEIEWMTYPGMKANPNFIAAMEQQVDKESLVLFLCRSGARSHAAASAATAAGFTASYNVLEGFEGDPDGALHRNTINGWRAAGLPWVQS
ncbi:MAG: rhodanese [Gallionellales bacterium CG03_land_8_20_14_0_80_55_15]|nr:rhodanese-like domain-containing protein [Gallionella sp.]PIV15339.1 MAG: rhodanese [Gallionellales bacterium CG03_land_8_20_14_0_80_55_15]HCJ50588.1 rhodanese [Gallionella sp.]